MLHKVSRITTSVGVLVMCAAVGDMAHGDGVHSQQSNSVLDIADARALPLGTLVTIEGSVTVPSGAFTSSTFDQGFAIQDETAGIYVSVAEDPDLKILRRVRVTGVLDDDGFGLLVVRPSSLADIERLRGIDLVPREFLSTGAIDEDSEGRLVIVEGVVTRPVTDDTPFGNSVFIDDGSGETQIFIPVTTGIDPFALDFIQLGARIQVKGFSAQFLQQYEVLPRFRRDIRRAPHDDGDDGDDD